MQTQIDEINSLRAFQNLNFKKVPSRFMGGKRAIREKSRRGLVRELRVEADVRVEAARAKPARPHQRARLQAIGVRDFLGFQ